MMKYQGLFMAMLTAVAGSAYAAGESDNATTETSSSQRALRSEYRVQCIETAIMDELTGDQFKQYVESCVAARLAGKKPAA